MKKTELNVSNSDLFKTVFPYLSGHVFHVTKLKNLENIVACGEIRVNQNEEFETTFGSTSNSFFRNRGCVSLFDYRNTNTELFEKHAFKCIPTQAASPENGIVVFIISENLYPTLISWRLWHNDEAYNQMVLPYFETGYPGSILLSNVTKTIKITVNED